MAQCLRGLTTQRGENGDTQGRWEGRVAGASTQLRESQTEMCVIEKCGVGDGPQSHRMYS